MELITYGKLQIMIVVCSDLHYGPGDLWSGSEGGVIMVWPWESIEKSMALTVEERHLAALVVERSCIDLKILVTGNSVFNIFTSDVKHMWSGHSGTKVWSAGYLSFALW